MLNLRRIFSVLFLFMSIPYNARANLNDLSERQIRAIRHQAQIYYDTGNVRYLTALSANVWTINILLDEALLRIQTQPRNSRVIVRSRRLLSVAGRMADTIPETVTDVDRRKSMEETLDALFRRFAPADPAQLALMYISNKFQIMTAFEFWSFLRKATRNEKLNKYAQKEMVRFLRAASPAFNPGSDVMGSKRKPRIHNEENVFYVDFEGKHDCSANLIQGEGADD